MDIPTHEELVAQIEAFLVRHPKVAVSRLGRDSTGEPGLIQRIREGDNVTLKTLQRLAVVMAGHDREAGFSPANDEAPPEPAIEWPLAGCDTVAVPHDEVERDPDSAPVERPAQQAGEEMGDLFHGHEDADAGGRASAGIRGDLTVRAAR